nr:unnamed protein product [Callosobruchus analis]
MEHQMDTTMELFCTSVFPIWLPVKVKPPVIMLAQVLCVWEVYIPGVQVRDEVTQNQEKCHLRVSC